MVLTSLTYSKGLRQMTYMWINWQSAAAAVLVMGHVQNLTPFDLEMIIVTSKMVHYIF